MDLQQDASTDKPQWIWCEPTGGGRNVFALFRRQIVVDGPIAGASLALFADARWRLRVNGGIVAYGPGRFVPSHPEYDRIDLVPLLQPGVNELLVEVWSPGSSSFQAMPESSGGFIAWGCVGIGGHVQDLATPGAWQVQRSLAWDTLAPAYSFAQGPVEVLDTARIGMEAWTEPVLRIARPWGDLAPRSIPAFGHRLSLITDLRLVAELAAGEMRLSCRQLRDPSIVGGQRFAYALPIRSPRDQEVSIGLFWGPHWLNGAGLTMSNDPSRGNRQNATVSLRAGWNLLYGEPQILTEVWSQPIALPADADVNLGAMHIWPPMGMAAVPSRTGQVPARLEDLRGSEAVWRILPDEELRCSHPARDMAWDRVDRHLSGGLPITLDAEPGRPGWVMVADTGGEFLGHIQIAIEAPVGTTLDVASDERVRDDGLIALYACNPFVDGADRIVLSGGSQVVELFHARGGRFIQLAIRPPATGGRVVVRHLAVRDHQVPVARVGTFSSSDPVFNWTWDAAYRTLQACVEDSFLDCPWRERGTYLGDALVETATLATFDPDVSVAKRTLHLHAQAQMPDGQMQDCAPSWHRHAFGDFSLIWILLLHQLWERDGGLDDVRCLWPAVQRMLASPSWARGDDGLLSLGAGVGMFIDWGVDRCDRDGAGNACLNAFHIRALACAAELADALALPEEAGRLRTAHVAACAAFRRNLWLPEAGRFARRMLAGAPDPEGLALHANVLVLAFGIADAQQEPTVLAHVERWLVENPARCLGDREDGYLELYFLSYALQGLYRCGCGPLAERVMREHWGIMHARGAWTIWESLRRGADGRGSLCHAWSTTPARWFHERVLGVRQVRAGDPSEMRIAPDSALAWAEGTVPHPAGPIHVSWRRIDGLMRITATAPPGVVLHIQPDDRPLPAPLQARQPSCSIANAS